MVFILGFYFLYFLGTSFLRGWKNLVFVFVFISFQKDPISDTSVNSSVFLYLRWFPAFLHA